MSTNNETKKAVIKNNSLSFRGKLELLVTDKRLDIQNPAILVPESNQVCSISQGLVFQSYPGCSG